MSHTPNDATVKRDHSEDVGSLTAPVLACAAARNFTKHKALRWKTPDPIIGQAWTDDPARCRSNRRHIVQGPSS